MDDQVVRLARELQHSAGLDEQTPADFNHINKFEKGYYCGTIKTYSVLSESESEDFIVIVQEKYNDFPLGS